MAFGGAFGTKLASSAAKEPAGRGSEAALDLQHVDAAGAAALAQELEAKTANATSREDAAGQVTQHLFDRFRYGEQSEPACALVRCFQTCTLSTLPKARRLFAMRQLGSAPYRDEIRCLTLLATRGIDPLWNRVGDSTGHQAIPLPSVEVILRAPMIARLLLQMGVRYEHVVSPPEGGDFMVGASTEALRVFHVARARGSQYIPAQASFVHRYGIRSVLGLGGLLPTGDLCAVVMFTRVQVSRETAEHFRTLAAAVRTIMLRFPPEDTFAN